MSSDALVALVAVFFVLGFFMGVVVSMWYIIWMSKPEVLLRKERRDNAT